MTAAAAAFPGATALTGLRVYDWPTTDGSRPEPVSDRWTSLAGRDPMALTTYEQGAARVV